MPPFSEPEAFGVKAAVMIKAMLLELRIGQDDGRQKECFCFEKWMLYFGGGKVTVGLSIRGP
jgi:hypothetical protein